MASNAPGPWTVLVVSTPRIERSCPLNLARSAPKSAFAEGRKASISAIEKLDGLVKFKHPAVGLIATLPHTVVDSGFCKMEPTAACNPFPAGPKRIRWLRLKKPTLGEVWCSEALA